ncbi:D-alanyl-D-alanine carboxypeptidase/D-alanyl-D-alanine-endopeptidase [Robiginitalea sp. IMCC43444]|uniref:D-alanyl-D-alanine carboxypeptidase/D-alanyl-D-alanine-endopeptidase n=1 Tax=Robiginitalea sp. IMCC43444 TaxID=3459121 RepID=UPI0040421F61
MQIQLIPKTFFLTFLLGLSIVLSSCSTNRKIKRFVSDQVGDQVLTDQFTGLLIIDAGQRDTLYSQNANRLFTPASNQKLFTLYAALKTLPEKLPALKYRYDGDLLYILGTGYPATLHPYFQDSTAIRFLQEQTGGILTRQNLGEPYWAPGWAWEDFDRGYMPEKTAFPIYGNVLRLQQTKQGPEILPQIFEDSIVRAVGSSRRDLTRNRFYLNGNIPDTLEVPLRLDFDLQLSLWGEASGRQLNWGADPSGEDFLVLEGIPTDSLLRRMMQQSDNFLAEQTLLMVSSTLGEELSFEIARDYILKEHLASLPQQGRWVDASGLSRYNLTSPESLVYLLYRMYSEVPRQRLFGLLAQGGADGTLKDYFRDAAGPYLFGKTGTLSNNHSLSGYLVCKSGKIVIFSFMNNHYTRPTRLIRERMQRILNWIREHY